MSDAIDERPSHQSSDAQPAPFGPPGALLALGVGNGSSVERIKVESVYLGGSLAEELAQPTTHLSADAVQLIKFHGSYQQEDRDARQQRKQAGAEKAYQFMVRSRIPGGALTSAQYLAEDRIAGRYGNGTLRFTTRQGIQLHGILKRDLQATIRGINRSLLSTLAACGDVNRNVMACPAPISNRAQAQIQAVAHTLAMHLAPKSTAYHELWLDGEKVATVDAPDTSPTTNSGDSVEPIYGPTYLPRKFKIGVAYPGDNCIDVLTQDVGLVAELEGDALAGFTILLGGGLGSTHGKTETYARLATPFAFVPPEQVVRVVETIMTVQRDYGDRNNRKHSRMKYLVEEQGIAWFRAQTEARLGEALADPHPVDLSSQEDHLGWHEQADGRWFLGLFVENGRIQDAPAPTAPHLRTALRQVAKRFAPNLRITPHQNVLLTDIAAEDRAAVEALLQRHHIQTNPEAVGVKRHAMACPALPTCGLAVAESERVLPDLMRELTEDLEDLGLDDQPLSVRMTGCPNGCARPYTSDIGIVGRSKGLYHLSLGGDWGGTRMNTLYAENVRLEHIAETLRPLFALWGERRQPGEHFGDFCFRIGFARLRALASDSQWLGQAGAM